MLLTKRIILIKAIQTWKEYFDDETDYVCDYFKVFNAEKNLCYTLIGESPISMLMACEYDWRYGNKTFPFVYLSGVCTQKNYRNQGYSTRLIKDTLLKSYDEGKILCGLIVANEGLKDFYQKFGFVACCSKGKDFNFLEERCSPSRIQEMFSSGVFNKLDNTVVHSKESLSLYPQYYGSVDCSDNADKQMLRIINAEEALKLYAEKFPEKELVFELKDQVFEKNNQVFTIQKSRVFSQKPQLVSPINQNKTIPQISIEELTTMIFKDAYMFLMNER